MSPADELALRRTEWALERTQLAWVRTAFSLVTAGLGIERGISALHESEILTNQVWLQSARVGAVLIALCSGIQLAVATLIYVRRQRELCRTYSPQASSWPVVVPLSIGVMIFAFVVAMLLIIYG